GSLIRLLRFVLVSWPRLYARKSSVESDSDSPPIFRGHVFESAGEDFSASSGFETAPSPAFVRGGSGRRARHPERAERDLGPWLPVEDERWVPRIARRACGRIAFRLRRRRRP